VTTGGAMADDVDDTSLERRDAVETGHSRPTSRASTTNRMDLRPRPTTSTLCVGNLSNILHGPNRNPREPSSATAGSTTTSSSSREKSRRGRSDVGQLPSHGMNPPTYGSDDLSIGTTGDSVGVAARRHTCSVFRLVDKRRRLAGRRRSSDVHLRQLAMPGRSGCTGRPMPTRFLNGIGGQGYCTLRGEGIHHHAGARSELRNIAGVHRAARLSRPG